MPRSFKLDFPPGFPLINVNNTRREHWSKRAPEKAALRQLACALSKNAHIPRLEEVDIIATYFPPDKRRRDAPNVLYLSTKACIDGFVDAGVIEDDCDEHVRSLKLMPGREVIRRGQMIIEITEVSDGGFGV